MILLDPDLDPDPAPASTSAKRTVASGPTALQKNLRLPAARTLARFLALAQATVRLNGDVTVLLTTDAAIRKLNARFRGKNQATDVLSFPSEGPICGSPAEKIAGDLAISVPTALRQAIEQGHSLTTEIKILILHGLLHLSGYDHASDSGQMARRELLLRARLGLPQGLIERAKTAAQLPRRGGSRIAQGKRSAALGMPAQNVSAPRRGAAKSSHANASRSVRP
jgi:probable rRNA maturation factor